MILHNDVDMPFPKPDQDPYLIVQLRALLRRHPKTTDHLGAHAGSAASSVRSKDQLAMIGAGSRRSRPRARLLRHLLGRGRRSTSSRLAGDDRRRTAALINRYPDRFLFGTDEVAPHDQTAYLKVYDMYAPLLAALTPEASEKVAEGQLRAALRRGAHEGAGLGESQRRVIRSREDAARRRTRVRHSEDARDGSAVR